MKIRFLPTAVMWLAAVSSFPAPVPLTILHTNDTHGHLFPFSYSVLAGAGSPAEEMSVRRNIGGMARRATLVRRLRTELAAKTAAVWLVDAGDICDGTPFSVEYHGWADVDAMNAAGYSFATLGNHEFNNRLADLKKLIQMARYPVLCANALETGSGQPLAKPFLVEKVGPVRVGVFGLVTYEASGYPAAREGVRINREVETARKIMETLRPQTDLIILISHCGDDMDRTIARKVPGIDVIVGGHSHSRLPAGEEIWRSDELLAKKINGTVMVQDFFWGGELGRLDLLLEKDSAGTWNVCRYRERLIPVTADIPEDSAVARVLDGYWKLIASRYGEVIGRAALDFTRRGDDLAHYNLVADAERAATGADIALEGLGGVRADLIQGPITRGDLATLDPFDDTVMTFRITGKELKRVLLENAPAVSGLRYRIENRGLAEATINGKALDENQTYSSATNSYFAEHNLRGMPRESTGKQRRETVIQYIRKLGTIHPQYDGRRVILDSGK